jgi:predicted Na+-dependent transporter
MSNIVCFLARADLDLSVAMTTCSSLAAIFMMPLNVFLYIRLTGLAEELKLDYAGIVLSAGLVILGIGSGVGTKMRAAVAGVSGERAMKVVAILGVIGGFGTMLTSLIKNAQSETPVWGSDSQMYVAAFLQALLGLLLGFGFARAAKLPYPSCVAVSVETSVQNAILAMAILAITFADDEETAGQAAVVPMCYGECSANVLW